MSHSGRQIEVSNVWKVFGENPDAALRPEHASKSREEIRQELGLVVGLRDVSFAVDTGEVFVVMGLSGSGKSTLVALPHQAHGSHHGTDLFRRRGYLPHISHINPAWRAVISNIGDRCSRIADHSSHHEC